MAQINLNGGMSVNLENPLEIMSINVNIDNEFIRLSSVPTASINNYGQRKRIHCWLCNRKVPLIGDYCHDCIESGFISPVYY